jgi:hypothetical protein
MKPLIILSCFFTVATLSLQSTLACTCGELKNPVVITAEPPPTTEEIRKWRAGQTDYAFFVGQVIQIEKIKAKRSQYSNEKSPMKKVTVKVDRYWLGITHPEMIIFTGVGGGDCGVPYQKGNRYLFVASRDPVTHLLETNICGPTMVGDKVVGYFDEIFGTAKSFS